MNQSSSSLVKEFLLQAEIPFTFTPSEVCAALAAKGVSKGGVGGFLSRLAKRDIILVIGRRDDEFVYTLPAHDQLREVRVNAVAGLGSQPGRADGPHKTRKLITRESVASQLLEIAAQLEQIRPSLEDFSTEELLTELMKRQKK